MPKRKLAIDVHQKQVSRQDSVCYVIFYRFENQQDAPGHFCRKVWNICMCRLVNCQCCKNCFKRVAAALCLSYLSFMDRVKLRTLTVNRGNRSKLRSLTEITISDVATVILWFIKRNLEDIFMIRSFMTRFYNGHMASGGGVPLVCI